MNIQKKKLINFRPVLIFAVAMIIADVFAIKVFVSQLSRLIMLIILAVFLLALIIIRLVHKRKYLHIYIAVLFAFLIPFVSVYIRANKIKQNFCLNAENCEIYGKIYKINENLDKNYVDVYLTDVQLLLNDESKDFYGNFLIRVNSNNFDVSKLENGRYARSFVTPTLFSLNSGDESDIYYLSHNIMGISYTYFYNFSVTEECNPTLRDNIRKNVYSYFKETNLFFTNIGYAMLFGDTLHIEDSVYDVFELSGTVHLLSVSGFHVSVIVSLLIFLFKKLKANNYVSFSVTALVLIFYAYLCEFSASVVRSIIMSLLVLYASIRNKDCDRMSSLCAAAIFIITLNPLDLFNISFVLSFVSVLSIILLMPVFERFFSKFFKDKLASSLSLSLSISIGVTMFELYYFGSAPVLSFISNIVTVPIVSGLFVFLIVSVLLGPIFGLAVPLIELFGLGMKYVLQFNNWIANIGLYLVVHNVREITLLLSILLMYALSDYLFVKRKNRVIIAGLFGAIMLSLLIF